MCHQADTAPAFLFSEQKKQVEEVLRVDPKNLNSYVGVVNQPPPKWSIGRGNRPSTPDPRPESRSTAPYRRSWNPILTRDIIYPGEHAGVSCDGLRSVAKNCRTS